MKAFCKHYEKEKVISKAESLVIQNKYKNGFQVYFQSLNKELGRKRLKIVLTQSRSIVRIAQRECG
jgi:hypothetical protein